MVSNIIQAVNYIREHPWLAPGRAGEESNMKTQVLLAMILVAGLGSLPEHTFAQLTHEEDSEVTFEAVNERYWYYDITRFSDMTYDEQVAEIATLNVEGFTGTWHMATYEEISTLWEYSAEAIFSSFALTMDDDQVEQWYTLGRYDESPRDGSHYFAQVERTSEGTYEKSVLNYLDYTPDSLDFEVLGAWVVYEGEPPAQVGTTICSTLGAKGNRSDADVFRFNGTEGEDVTIRLEASPPESGAGKRVMLVLRNVTGGLQLFRRINRALPHEITVTLPLSGDYQVMVAESPGTPGDRVVWGERYFGDYCIVLEGSPELLETFEVARSVE